MIDAEKLLEELYCKSKDSYKIARVIHQYCCSEECCEEIQALVPLTKILQDMTDNISFGLSVLKSGADPDGDSEEIFTINP